MGDLQIKGGKFLSHFGRINEQHGHYWDFTDPPLVYAVFYGDEMLNEIGARLTRVPPLDWYLMLGIRRVCPVPWLWPQFNRAGVSIRSSSPDKTPDSRSSRSDAQ